MGFLDRHREIIILSLFAVPFAISISLVEFSMPLKYDTILENLPLLGSIISLAWLLGSFTVLSIGDLSDKIGNKRMVLLGVLLVFGGALLFGIADSLLFTTVGIFIWAVGYQAVTIPYHSYILSAFPRNYRGSALGIFYFFFCIAYAFTPLLAFYLITNYSIDHAILVGAVVVLPALLIRMRPLKQKYEELGKAVKEVIADDGVIFKEIRDIAHLGHRELSLFFNQFIFGFWYVTMAVGAPLLFFVGEGDVFRAALLVFAFVLPFAFIDVFFGSMSNNPGVRRKLVFFGLGGAVVFMLLFYFASDFPLMLLFAALSSMSIDIAWIANEVAVSDYLPPHKKGEFMGVYALARELGYDFAPVFYGMFAVVGLKFPFFAVAIVVFLGWLYFATHFMRKRPRRAPGASRQRPPRQIVPARSAFS